MIHAGIAVGISIGEVFLDDGAEDDGAGGGAVVVGTAIRVAAAGASSRHTAADEIPVLSARDDFGRNVEGDGGGAVIGGGVIRIAFGAGAAGVVTIHVHVGRVHPQGGQGIGVAVDLHGGREGGIKMLPIGDDVGDQRVLEGKEIGDLEVEGVFQRFARGRVATVHDGHRFLDGDGFVGQGMLAAGRIGGGVVGATAVARVERGPIAER